MDPSKHLPKGRKLNGIYTIEDVLGAGGFGITYRVSRPMGNIKLYLAVKEYFVSSMCSRAGDNVWVSNINQEQYDNGLRAFVNQAKIINENAIRYPYIAGVNEVFFQNNTAYYVMEYVHGDTLARYVDSRGGLSPDQALNLFNPILQAIHVFHCLRLLHLDIKPANVIIDNMSEPGILRPVLIDFDLSKYYEPNGSTSADRRFVSCSEGYAPPEQYDIAGLSLFSPQLDIYALGATLLYMLTAQGPEISTAFNRDQILQMLPAGTPVHIAKAIYNAMAPKPEDRTRSVKQFAAELGLDTSYWPMPQAESGTEPTRPKSGWRLVGVAALVAALIFCVYFFIFIFKPDRNKAPETFTLQASGQDIEMAMGEDGVYHSRPLTVEDWKALMGPGVFNILYGKNCKQIPQKGWQKFADRMNSLYPGIGISLDDTDADAPTLQCTSAAKAESPGKVSPHKR